MNPAIVCAQLIVFGLLLNSTAFAEHSHETLNAPSFSDPIILSEVPKDWGDTPLQHEPADSEADLVVALGQQSYPLFHALIHKYAAQKNLNIIVKPGTCGITSGRLRKKSVDIGAFCCPPSQSDRLPGLEFHSLGISPIALIVHPANPLKNMTVKQARKVFQGQINHWSELEPKSSKIPQQIIKPVARLHCKIRPGHWRGLLNNEDEFSPRLFEVGVIADMISQVANNTGAIGFEVPLMVSYHGNKGLVRMLDIDGHNVTDLSYLLAGKYPFYRSYSLTTWKSDSKEKYRIAKELVNYLQQYIEKNHTEISYIPPSQLRLAGWKFSGDELVGGPVSTNINKH